VSQWEVEVLGCHSGRLGCHSERLGCHSGRLRCHSGRLECHSGRLECHSGRLGCHSGSGSHSGRYHSGKNKRPDGTMVVLVEGIHHSGWRW